MSDTMKPFMEPTSVAIIGASRVTGPRSYNILENMINAGFAGKIYPVNPRADEILGLRAYPSVLDIPDAIDLAIVIVARLEVPRTIRECTQKGIKAIIVVSQGFGDGDDEGRKMQDDILSIARQGGARLLGPNTWGTANAFCNFATGFSPMVMKRIPIGFISQTGLYFGLPEAGGKGIDVGNMSDIDFADGLEYYEEDPSIRVIFLHVEGLPNGRRFMEVAARVARKKPILALKTGREEETARAVQSHTGSLVGRDEVYDGAFRQCGVMRVTSLDEFEDLAKAFLNLPLMWGTGVGIITPTGGAGIVALDLLRKYHLRLAQLSASSLTRINVYAPSWQRIDNPADIWPAMSVAGHPLDEVLATTLDSFLQDDNVHAVMLLFPTPLYEAQAEKAADILDIVERAGDKPVACWPDRPDLERIRPVLEKTGNIAFFPSLERAIRALFGLNARWRYLHS